MRQPFGGSQSPDDARIAGIARAKREALEQFGTYIESTTVVKNAHVDSDEILALTAGVTKAEVIKQKNYADGDAFGIEITVTVELDTAVLEKSLKRLIGDRNHLKDLKAAREREKKLLARISELEKENQQKGKTKEQSAKLKDGFQAASQGLTAVEWFDKAVALWDGNNYSDLRKVIEYLTQAIRLAPNISASAYSNRGLAYSHLKQFDRAIADYDRAIRLDPKDATAYSNRGVAYSDLRQFKRAIADFDQAIHLEPNYANAYVNRGNAYADLNQPALAIANYDQAIRLDQDNAKAYYNRGSAYYDLKEFAQTIADYGQSIRLDPSNAASYYNRGLAHFDLKQFDRAIADYDRAIRLDPYYARAYHNRGYAYANLKQFVRAIADYDQAIHLDPKDATAYTNRGIAYGSLKQFDRAIVDYDRAIRLDPNNATAYDGRGVDYIVQGKTQKGCADLKKACKLGKCNGLEFVRLVVGNNKLCR